MASSDSNSGQVREILRVVFSMSLIIIGIAHFVRAEQFARIVPPIFPTYPSVYISGAFEILGGIGLLIPSVSVAAAWGLIALFIAVFPANIYMAVHNIKLDGVPQSQLLYWGRLPLQAVLIAWAWWYTKHPKQSQIKAIASGTENI